MQVLLVVPIVLSLVVLGAHFLRDGLMVGVAVSALLIGLLFVRRPWVARVVQTALLVGAFEWVLTLYVMTERRLAGGGSATRLIIILAGVALVTLLSAFLFQTGPLRKLYRLDAGGPQDA